MSDKKGPTEVEIKYTVWKCQDCKWHERRRVGNDMRWHIDHYCQHPTAIEVIFVGHMSDDTPDWCPVLEARK